MSSKSGNRSSGGAASGSQVEEAEDEESSSSSLSSASTIVEDELENFRQKWKHEVTSSSSPSTSRSSRFCHDDSPDAATEDIARRLFLEGVEHEQNGELFEAIQKYRKAVNLVPDIEFRAFEHNVRRNRQMQKQEATGEKGDASEDEADELPVDDEKDAETDLVVKFSRLTVKTSSLCTPEDAAMNGDKTHIACLPMELLIYILKWVVSSDLDLRSLEAFASVCRGFYLASRSSDIWRLVCVETWGVSGLPIEEPSLGGWRELYLSRPRVNLNGCYLSKVSYLREGERGFQDSQFYKSWHVVHYYRIIRFFAGGRVIMATTAEEPNVAVKLFNSRTSCAIQGCMFGFYRTVNNRVLCVLQKPKEVPTRRNTGSQMRRRNKNRNAYSFEVPEQDFTFELEIKGKQNRQLQWLCYSVISKYKNGTEQIADIDVSNPSNYPNLYYSRVKSFTTESVEPLI